MLVKTPTFSSTGDPHVIQRLRFVNIMAVNELLASRLWYRTKAKIVWLFCGNLPEVSIARPSPIARLPQELMEMVISCFVYDKQSLLACSMTCYSWYMIAVSYLHYSLTIDDEHSLCGFTTRYSWPRPLEESFNLGLLPHVKRFRIRLGKCNYERIGFASNRLGGRTLRYFSALTNLQELGIDYLRIPSFLPNIQRYFEHFSPTLLFLALRNPSGSCRQVLYFISLFPNLQDLKLCYYSPEEQQSSAADPILIPLSVPPLRGRLILTCLATENLVKDMIILFKGLRFRHMDLFMVKYAQLLLDASVETLETLRVYPTDLYGKEFPLKEENELKRAICRKQQRLASPLQSVAEQAPPDTRDHSGSNQFRMGHRV